MSNNQVAENTWHLRLSASKTGLSSFKPGMFLMLHLSEAHTFDPLLNRPFSFSFINEKEGWFDLLYRVVGRGTAILSRKKPGETLEILAPLGKGFPLDPIDVNSPILLIGGGMGIAPLLSCLSERNSDVHALFWGIRTRGEYFDIKTLYPLPERILFHLSTDDGSLGNQGTVIELFETYLTNHTLPDNSVIFACGPPQMLYSLYILSRMRKAPLYVSMETRMACGFGYCLGCALPCLEGGYRHVCQDGPVFPASDIDWEQLNERN